MSASIEKRTSALGCDAPDGVVGAGAMDVGDRDMGALLGEQQRHRPAVADRIGRGIEGPLSAADDQDPAALKTPASRRFTSGLRAERANVTRLVGHARFHASASPQFYFGANPNVCSNRLA